MREVKFRGKLLEPKGLLNAGDWVEGGYYGDDCYGGCPEGKHYIVSWNSAGPGGYTELLQVDRETVGQYTGIKEIFEGDVVKGNRIASPAPKLRFERFFGQVVYKGAKFVIDGVKQYEWIREDLDGSYEVIGNIYDNPELLNEK